MAKLSTYATISSITGTGYVPVTDDALGTPATKNITPANLRTAMSAQPLDSTLTALAAYNTNGLITQTAADTFTGRTLTGPVAGITVSNGDGVSGNPTLALANDLAAVEALASNGLAARTASDTWAVRTLTGTTDQITVTNGDGVSGNPTISLPTNPRVRCIGGTIYDSTAVAVGKIKGFVVVPFSGTITAWAITVDAGTATIKVWKIATGTAKPTSANSINTSGVSISTGTHVRSTTMTDFTSTTVTANDIFAFNVEAVSGVTELSFSLEITAS